MGQAKEGFNDCFAGVNRAAHACRRVFHGFQPDAPSEAIIRDSLAFWCSIGLAQDGKWESREGLCCCGTKAEVMARLMIGPCHLGLMPVGGPRNWLGTMIVSVGFGAFPYFEIPWWGGACLLEAGDSELYLNINLEWSGANFFYPHEHPIKLYEIIFIFFNRSSCVKICFDKISIYNNMIKFNFLTIKIIIWYSFKWGETSSIG